MVADPPGSAVARRAGVPKRSAQSKVGWSFVQVVAEPEEVSAEISDSQKCGTRI